MLCRRPGGRLRAGGRRLSLPRCQARAVCRVRAIAPSGQDPPDRVRPPGGGQLRTARVRKTGNLQLSEVHVPVRQIAPRTLPPQAENRTRSHSAKLKEVTDGLRQRMHQPIPVQEVWLRQSLPRRRPGSSPASLAARQCRPTCRHSRPAGFVSSASGGARSGGAARRTPPQGRGSRRWRTTSLPNRASCTPGRASVSPLPTGVGAGCRQAERPALCGGGQ
jgi:hypothetical protein